MKKKVIIRALIGALIGFFITALIPMIISLVIGDGDYHPVVPQLAEACGNEMNAVLVQSLMALLYGAVWGGVTVIWEVEVWSLLRMTVTHLLVTSLSTLPIAYVLYWMPHTIAGVLLYFGIFFGIYAVIWLSQYRGMKKRVMEMNAGLQKRNSKN